MSDTLTNTNTYVYRNRNNYKILRWQYENAEFELFFPKENIKYKKINKSLISTDTFHQDILREKKYEIEYGITNILENESVNIHKMEKKFDLLQKIIDSFELKSFIDDFNISELIELLPFFFDLGLLSLIGIIFNQFRIYFDGNNLTASSDENKEKIYIGFINVEASIQISLHSLKEDTKNRNLQIIRNLTVLHNDCIDIILNILKFKNKKDIEFFISCIKNEFLKNINIGFDENNKIFYSIELTLKYILVNILKMIVMTLLSLREISNIDKLKVLLYLVTSNDHLIIIKSYCDTTTLSFLEIANEAFSYYDKNIYSSVLTRVYNKIIVLFNNDFPSVLRSVIFILNLKNEKDDDFFFDLNPSFNNEITNNIRNYFTMHFKNPKKKPIKFDNRNKEEKSCASLLSLLDKDKLLIKKLVKDKEELEKKIRYLSEINSTVNNYIFTAISNIKNIKKKKISLVYKYINQLMDDLIGSFPLVLKSTFNSIVYRGYDSNKLRNVLKALHFYNKEKNEYFSKEFDLKVFYVLDNQIIKFASYYTRFNSCGSINKTQIYKMLSEKDKQYCHSLIKEKYINSNPLIEQENGEVDETKKIIFKNVCYYSFYCTFKDELNRNIVGFVEKINKDSYVPKIYQLENKKLIQAFKESQLNCNIFHYKDVLDLNNVKDYIFLCNYNNSFHILLLNNTTKLFESMKIIFNKFDSVKVIPYDNLQGHLLVLYDFKVKHKRSTYKLETDCIIRKPALYKVSDTLCSAYYCNDRRNQKENIYIVDCTIDSVRLLKNNEKLEVFKEFVTKSDDNLDIMNAIVLDRCDNKFFICSNFFDTWVFRFEDQSFVKLIENTGCLIARLSSTKILSYSSNNINEYFTIDFNPDNTILMRTISLEKKGYLHLVINPILLKSNKNYLSLLTEKEELRFHKLN